jgi:hypothetical protein
MVLGGLDEGATSFGKQEPPKPGPACRNFGPILLSSPMPRATSCTSAPTLSQRSAISLMKRRLGRAAAEAWSIARQFWSAGPVNRLFEREFQKNETLRVPTAPVRRTTTCEIHHTYGTSRSCSVLVRRGRDHWCSRWHEGLHLWTGVHVSLTGVGRHKCYGKPRFMMNAANPNARWSKL